MWRMESSLSFSQRMWCWSFVHFFEFWIRYVSKVPNNEAVYLTNSTHKILNWCITVDITLWRHPHHRTSCPFLQRLQLRYDRPVRNVVVVKSKWMAPETSSALCPASVWLLLVPFHRDLIFLKFASGKSWVILITVSLVLKQDSIYFAGKIQKNILNS